jgi:hypothetical protein
MQHKLNIFYAVLQNLNEKQEIRPFLCYLFTQKNNAFFPVTEFLILSLSNLHLNLFCF